MFTRSQHHEGGFLRTLVMIGLLFTCLRVWVGPSRVIDSAQAQIPDSGRQRQQIVEELRQANRTLSQIHELLRSGTLHVHLEGADKPSTDNAGRHGG